MIYELSLRVLPQQAYNESTLKEVVAREKNIDVRTITKIRILKRSIDARQRTIFVNLTLRIYVNGSCRIVCSIKTHRVGL